MNFAAIGQSLAFLLVVTGIIGCRNPYGSFTYIGHQGDGYPNVYLHEGYKIEVYFSESGKLTFMNMHSIHKQLWEAARLREDIVRDSLMRRYIIEDFDVAVSRNGDWWETCDSIFMWVHIPRFTEDSSISYGESNSYRTSIFAAAPETFRSGRANYHFSFPEFTQVDIRTRLRLRIRRPDGVVDSVEKYLRFEWEVDLADPYREGVVVCGVP